MPRILRLHLLLVMMLTPAVLLAAAPNGEAVFKQRCSGCHDSASPRIPSHATLQKMPSARIQHALDFGAMMAIGFTMNSDERIAVANWLGTSATVSGPPASAFCTDRTVKLSEKPTSVWSGWSPGLNNARFQPGAAAGLTVDQVRGLKLKWAFGFDGDVAAFAPPTVIDGQIFVGSAGGVVHALQAGSGCLQWTFQANAPVRSSIATAPLDGRHALLFGDMTGWFYAVEAETGKLLWKVRVETHDSTRLTGGPVPYNGTVYVPVASWEETRAGDQNYACCTFRGSVVALRIGDGKQLWKTYTTAEPKEMGRNANGVAQFGPSGAGIWSAPTIDAKRGVLYATTGNNYSGPDTDTSDAVIAFDLISGKIAWSKQVTAGDISPCRGGPKCGPDFDFGSSSILISQPGGADLILAGQKSGIVWALDPDKKGEIVWQNKIAKGGGHGGIQWGMAADDQRVYAAISDVVSVRQTTLNPSDPRRSIPDRNAGGGVAALRIADGSQAWRVASTPCADDAPVGCSPAQTGAVTALPGIIFDTSLDGHIRAHAAEDGRLLWDFNTARDFDTVNGVKAHGGSMEGSGAVVADGMVFITSGYPRNGGMPGNVLLAFGK